MQMGGALTEACETVCPPPDAQRVNHAANDFALIAHAKDVSKK
jgi:hypothetical protein